MDYSIGRSCFRTCDFQVSLFGGSIHLDFTKVVKTGSTFEMVPEATNSAAVQQLWLQGISFDGFGYCSLPSHCVMDANDSNEFFRIVVEEELDNTERASEILRNLFKKYKNEIWIDALEKYDLT